MDTKRLKGRQSAFRGKYERITRLSPYFHSVPFAVDPASEHVRLCQTERERERRREGGRERERERRELYRGFRGIEAFGDQVCPSVHGLVRLRCCKPIIPAAARCSPCSSDTLSPPPPACSTATRRVYDDRRSSFQRNGWSK